MAHVNDLDPAAVDLARENIEFNGLTHALVCEKDEKEDKDGKTEKEEAKTGKPSVMKMLDFSGVKLRETKPAIVQRPNTMKDTKDPKSQLPGWMEELNKKQANRRSVGNYLDQDSPEEPLPKTFQFSR